jgi:hypothetical protein
MTDPANLKAEDQRKLDAIRRRSTALEPSPTTSTSQI